MPPGRAVPAAGPRFLPRSSLAAQALAFVHQAYGRHRRAEDRVAHAVAVGALLQDAGCDGEVVAAGLLHDVLEDTAATAAQLRRRFGPRVARLVTQVTEDAAIGDYAPRKAALRAQAVGAGPDAAAIFAADKLASARALLVAGRVPAPARHRHFERTLQALRAADPGGAFVDELTIVLDRLGPATAERPADRATAAG